MSKKKRLGRGLEALLGVGSKSENEVADSTDSANQPTDTSPPSQLNPSGINLKNSGTEVSSIEDIASPSSLPQNELSSKEPKSGSASEAEEPTILKFEPKAQFAKKTTVAAQTSRPAYSSPMVPPAKPKAPNATSSDATSIDAGTPNASSFGGTPSNSKIIADVRGSGNESEKGVVELNVYDVDDNPFQPRREFNKTEIESLAESLKTHEQLQPILVRKVADRYQLISGERRLRAAIHAGWSKIRAQVREADDRLVAELAIVENLQRKDLNPVEKALSFRRYIDEHGCSQEDLAGRLKIDRSTVANLLRLLDLPEVVQKAIQLGIISNGHARALLPLGEEHLQIEFCNRIQREGLSVRAIEQLVRDKIDEEDGVKRKSASKGRTKSSQILSLESELRNALGTKVEIKATSRGRGKIVVHYLSRDEFERLRQLFGESDGQSDREAA